MIQFGDLMKKKQKQVILNKELTIAIEFLQVNGQELFQKTIEHFYISFVALLLAMVVSIPLGIVLTRTKKLAKIELSIDSVLQTVTTLEVLSIIIPLLLVSNLLPNHVIF